VVGDPVLAADDPRVRNPSAALAHACSGRPLPFAAGEVRSILSLLPPEQTFAALGPAASRDLLLDGRLARYRVLHLATHGRIDLKHPDRSELLLSCADEQGRPLDGHLRADELYRLRLSADLVVLSACETVRLHSWAAVRRRQLGRGEPVGGERPRHC
jgi:CHAT domain-containing protein